MTLHHVELIYNGEVRDDWYVLRTPFIIGETISVWEIGTRRFVGDFKVKHIDHDMYGYGVVLI